VLSDREFEKMLDAESGSESDDAVRKKKKRKKRGSV